MVIDNKLYDLKNFAAVHPGGERILSDFHNTDATEYFYALHSDHAIKMLSKLKQSDIPEKYHRPKSLWFNLEERLKDQGFFKPNYWIEALMVLHTIVLFGVAALLNNEHPYMAVFCLAIATMHGGWISHSQGHSRNSPMNKFSLYYSGILCGYSPSWWAEKHNRHHLECNEVENDGDIQLMPFIWLWAPKDKQDKWHRRFQHLYFGILYSILHLKWQLDGLIAAITNKNVREMFNLAIHYTLYICFFDFKVVFLAVWLSGTITAFVVTASHQGEEKLESKRDMLQKEGYEAKSPYEIHDYMKHQLLTTRSFHSQSWILNYISGGMQYQVEHHLFPKIPMYYLSRVQPHVKEFCKEHNLTFKEESVWDIMIRNYKTIEIFAFLKI